MKKILYLVLVAVLTVTAGTAWGQHTLGNIPDGWTVTADGNPVTVTSNGTAAIPAGATVTLTPLYPAKVKSVKLKDEGLLNGKFSISATNQVYFSQGNLQATYNGSAWSWAFATNQWDYIGNAEGNTKLTATTPFVSDYTGTSTTVDLFGWVGASSTWEGAAQYGITSSTEQSGGADGYGNIVSESLKSDWGTLAITNGGNAANNGWRTLTIDEWEWILGPVYSPEPYPSPSPNPGVNCRTSSTVGGTANARYAKATVADKPGLIIFPDSYTHPSDVTAPTNVNTYNADYTHNSYDATAWGKMESAGAVFLPAAGFRSGVTVNNAGLGGDYWSSSSKSDVPQSAYRVWLSSTILDPRYYSLRNNGSSVRLVKDAQIVNLSTLTGDYEAQNGDILIGTLAGNYKISIAAGATVTLNGATINGTNDDSYNWAGITCLGDATIILSGTNTVKGFNVDYPGIQAAHNTGSGDEYTLTIQGTGSLTASSNGWGAGIGGGSWGGCGDITIIGGSIIANGGESGAGIGTGSDGTCGNITISGGSITANGGSDAAGIGTGFWGTCGNITISGGSITANGGGSGAGIGTGFWGTCGNITISGGSITANGGSDAAGIGTGFGGNCGSITIYNTVTSVRASKGTNATNATNSIGTGDGGSCGTVTIDPSLSDVTSGNTRTISHAPSVPTGAINGLFSVSSTKQVYFSQGNLQYQASTGTWRFAEHQYDFIGNDNIYASETNPDWIDLYRWGTSGIDYTGHATKYLPWETSFNSADFNPYGSLTTNLYDGDGENAGKADWGYNAISNGGNTQNSGWRTLKNNTTDNEWQYIFNSRTTANEINSTSNARYTQACINTDGTLVKGIILFPDGSIGDTPSGVTWGAVNAASDWNTGTQCTTAGWAALEAAGCVFLPASGKGEPSGVSMVETEGYYWSSSCAEKYWSTEYAYGVYFYNNNVRPQYSDTRYYGCSVRLVKDAN